VLGRILEELGGLLENILLLRRCAIGTTFLGLAAFCGERVVDAVLDRFLASGCSFWRFWRFRLRRWRVFRRDALSPRSPPAEKSTLAFVFRGGGRLGGFVF
jgi:hypothetical protein